MTEPLRLGVIGMSEGNGHPYSWSAICNGYDREAMEDCGFPAIPAYLSKRRFPEEAIGNAVVSHVWTQHVEDTAHIARAARIPNVCKALTDMLGEVDGVLLARDDARNHFSLAAPFLDAGLPIYIDKPVALSLRDLDRLFARQRFDGQIFTCSALRFSPELKLSADDAEEIGPIRAVYASTPKDWERYGHHVIEPTLALLGDQGEPARVETLKAAGGIVEMTVSWESGVRAHFTAAGPNTACPLSFRVLGANGWRDLSFRDAFPAFKNALLEFVTGISNRGPRADQDLIRRSIGLLEQGIV